MPFYPQLYTRLRELVQASNGALAADGVEQAWLERYGQPLIWQHYGVDPTVGRAPGC